MKRMKVSGIAYIYVVRRLPYSIYIHRNRTRCHARRALNSPWDGNRHIFLADLKIVFPCLIIHSQARVHKFENYEGSNCISATIYSKSTLCLLFYLVDHGDVRFDSFHLHRRCVRFVDFSSVNVSRGVCYPSATGANQQS
jgi:hypothetical protein